MKKVLLIGPFPPLYSYGGPTKSIQGLYNVLNTKSIQCSVLSPSRELKGNKIIIEEIDNKILFSNNFYIDILKSLKNNKIMWFNSFFEFKLIWLLFLNSFLQFNLIVSPRGQLSHNAIYTSKPLFKFIFIKFVSFFNKSIYFHSTSKEESKEIKKYFRNARIKEISNISSNEFFNNSCVNKKFIFYSRIHKKKGLDILLSTIQKYNIKIELDIYGFIEDKDYWKKCEKYINDIKGVNYMGSLDDGDITKLNNKYSFFILPTLNENFGHVIIELLSIGCIPILSKNTNPFDEDISSIFNLNFDISDKSDLKNVINMANNMSDERFIKLKSSVRPYFDKLNENQEKIKKKYINFISDLL